MYTTPAAQMHYILPDVIFATECIYGVLYGAEQTGYLGSGGMYNVMQIVSCPQWSMNM